MGTKITTLKAKTSGDDVYPNIIAQNIPSSAVDESKVADASITTAKIADASITTAKIADASITTSKIANAAVTGEKIASRTITGDKLATDATLTLHTDSLAYLIQQAQVTTPSDMRNFITDFLSYDAGYLAPFFLFTKSTGLITEVKFWITDGVRYVAYAPINNMSNAVVLDSDAKISTFASGDAQDIEVQWLA